MGDLEQKWKRWWESSDDYGSKWYVWSGPVRYIVHIPQTRPMDPQTAVLAFVRRAMQQGLLSQLTPLIEGSEQGFGQTPKVMAQTQRFIEKHFGFNPTE